MNNDSDANAQEVRDQQKAWNTQYYHFLDVYQRSLLERARIFNKWCDSITANLRAGQIADALKSLALLKEKLGDDFKGESEMIQKHHGFVDQAMGNYQTMVEVIGDYSQANNQDDLARGAEIQLDGIRDFWLAPIATLDPDRA
jgi:hypothetical protein